MSIEDDIFEVRDALEGKPEMVNFERLERLIAGSSLLELIAEELRRIASDHKQNCAFIKNRQLVWTEQADLEYYERLIAWADKLQGFTHSLS